MACMGVNVKKQRVPPMVLSPPPPHTQSTALYYTTGTGVPPEQNIVHGQQGGTLWPRDRILPNGSDLKEHWRNLFKIVNMSSKQTSKIIENRSKLSICLIPSSCPCSWPHDTVMGPWDDLPREARQRARLDLAETLPSLSSGPLCGWIIWGRTTRRIDLYVSSGVALDSLKRRR